MNSPRKCTIQNHKNSIVTHICIYQDCNQHQRWVCSECVLENTHQHGVADTNYIIHFSDFPSQMAQQSPAERNLDQLIIQVKEYIGILQNLINLLNQNKKLFTDDPLRMKAQKLTQTEILLLTSQEISNFLQVKPKVNLNKIEECQSKIISFRTSLDQQISKALNRNKIQELKSFTQSIVRVEQSAEKIYTAQIFPNGQNIAFGGDDQQIYIQNMVTGNRNIIQIEDKIRYISISNDSSQLFAGTLNGSVVQLSEQTNFTFAQLFKYHTGQIYQILVISESIIITSSYDETIVIYDFMRRVIQRTIRVHTLWCDFKSKFYYCIDYNPQRMLIAGGSNHQRISLWNYEGDLYLQQIVEENQDTRIIQFSKDYKYLISLETESATLFSSRIRNSEIKIWVIDYDRKSLILIRKHREDQNIYSFSFIQDEQYLSIVLERTVKIIQTKNYATVSIIQHGVDDLFPFRTNQIDHLNQIVVKGKNTLNIAQLTGSQRLS